MSTRQSPFSPTVGAALEWARYELTQSESGPLEAQVLLGRVLGRPRSWILAHPETEFPQLLCEQYAALIQRIRGGEPLAYLTGVQEFFGLEFEVSPDVLIPRPETELLAATALQWLLDRCSEEGRSSSSIRVVDVGTGSGCITAALAVHIAGLRVIAADISLRALTVAERNLARHGVRDRVQLLQADLLSPLRGPIDLLCANLPYALTRSLDGSPVIRFEPRQAIDGGPDGLRLVARAIDQAAGRLAKGGLALFEIDTSHADEARKMAKRLFPHALVKVKKDLAGWERLLIIHLPG